VSEPIDDLQRTSDAVLTDVEKLQQLEQKRRAMHPDDPTRATVDAEAQRTARDLVDSASAETDLAEKVTEDPPEDNRPMAWRNYPPQP
jgi:hypothetical protein